jgi:hypothetical protein
VVCNRLDEHLKSVYKTLAGKQSEDAQKLRPTSSLTVPLILDEQTLARAASCHGDFQA